MPLDPQVEKFERCSWARTAGLPGFITDTSKEANAGPIASGPDWRCQSRRWLTAKYPVRTVIFRFDYTIPAGDAPFATLVYFHGGGWVIGDLDTHHGFCHALAKTSGCLVVAVDYRLAPEHRYPAAVEDAYAATKWVAENSEVIQADPDRFAVCGDSAGGHLAAVVSLMARDRNGPRIDLQILIYPITDCRFDTPSYEENREGYMLTRDLMKWFWNQFINDESEADDPYVSPCGRKVSAIFPRH